jgi:hypothetical protein
VASAQTAVGLAGVARPTQATIPEPSLDALAKPFLQELEHVVDADRLDRRLVRARQ